ncbi:MAG: hypothetical protein R3B91_18430 [Planctomycetaceae bacterium]
MIDDVKTYLKSNPQQVDWQQTQIDNLGYRLVQQNEKKYVGEQVAQWDVELEPRPEHFDRRVTITTPLQQAGLSRHRQDGGREHQSCDHLGR